MTYWSVCLFCAFFLSPPVLAQQEVLSVPLVDKSAAGRPLDVNGEVLLRETVRANELEWSWSERISVKNVSTKPILLFVATLTEIGRHPAPTDRSFSPGNGPTYQLEDDRFFSERLIKPGELLLLRDSTFGAAESACCINPLSQKRDPSAEYRVRFVQFADGSTFGEPGEGRDALAMRDMIMSGLRELVQSYKDHGKAGFVDKLREQSPVSATSPWRRVLAEYGDRGAGAALAEVRRILADSNFHAAMIAGTETLNPLP